MGRTADIVFQYYDAFRHDNIDGVLAGWHPDGVLVPFGRRRSYRGHGEIRLYLEKEMHEEPEFDFRIYTVLDVGNHALTFGRYSVREGEAIIDRGVFCISEVRDQKLVFWEAFENVGEAFHEFRQRLSASV